MIIDWLKPILKPIVHHVNLKHVNLNPIVHHVNLLPYHQISSCIDSYALFPSKHCMLQGCQLALEITPSEEDHVLGSLNNKWDGRWAWLSHTVKGKSKPLYCIKCAMCHFILTFYFMIEQHICTSICNYNF